MEVRPSKHVKGVCYTLTINYVKVHGYGSGEEIRYSQIPEKTKGWLKIIQKEMFEFYDERFPEKTCPVCGKKFRDNKRVVCSPKCSHQKAKEMMVRPVEEVCAVCGKTFTKQRNAKRKTCSDECSKALNNSKIKDSWNERMSVPQQKNDVERRTKKKKKSQIGKIEKDARKHGLHYADIQKQKTLAMVGGVNTEIEPAKKRFIIYD